MGLTDVIAANPLQSFLVVIIFLFLLVIWRSQKKAKLKAAPFLVGSLFAYGFLYVSDFRSAVVSKLGISNLLPADRLAIGIQQSGANALLWTSAMTDAFILGFGAAVVAWATGSRKLGFVIGLATALYLVAKAWAIISPIWQAFS